MLEKIKEIAADSLGADVSTMTAETSFKEDLGAGTAGARVAHHPEVIRHIAAALIVTDTHDAIGRHPYFLIPDIVSFIVFGIHRHPKLFFRKHEVLG